MTEVAIIEPELMNLNQENSKSDWNEKQMGMPCSVNQGKTFAKTFCL